jgi:hypothetical protein
MDSAPQSMLCRCNPDEGKKEYVQSFYWETTSKAATFIIPRLENSNEVDFER